MKDVTTEIIRSGVYSDTNETAFNYLKEVAFGFETGSASEVIRKWMDDVYIKVHACNSSGVTTDINADDYAEIVSIVSELNSLIDTINITLLNTSVTDICEDETHAGYGGGACYKSGYPQPNINFWITTRSRWETISGLDASGLGGQFTVNYGSTTGHMTAARLWVNSGESTNRNSFIREELTQAFGLGKDSESYEDSIFYETEGDGGFATAYSDLDKQIIQMLYDPRLKPMMTKEQAEEALKKPAINIAGRSWSFAGNPDSQTRVSYDKLDSRMSSSNFR
tara:strand:+ start:13828 stop:14670 length:843 start_codon:yes stop_codon:yes gene_type:complete